MKKMLILGLILSLVGLLSSCAMFEDSPNKVFQVIALNANKIPHDFHRPFKEIQAQKDNNSLIVIEPGTNATKNVGAVEFVDYFYSKMLESDIEKVALLKESEEVKPIKEAALEMFRFVDEIYKNDYPKIAKMIDDGQSQADIEAAIDDLEATKGAELYTLYERVMTQVIPYADKHGVEYKTIEMPSWPRP